MVSPALNEPISRLVELAGPAGAGKTATRRALTARVHGRPGMIWGLAVPSLVLNGVQMMPGFIPLWREARSPLWDETRHMVRLRTLRQALQRNGAEEVIVFDEGPVFALAWLRGFGHPVMRHAVTDQWWRTTFQEWAGVVGTVVVLDAPDELLARRIRNRLEDHEVKQDSDLEIAAWMARFRQALDWVLDRLTLETDMTVLRLDTGTAMPEELAERAVAVLERGVHAG